jgi:uncharacterized cupredoxin-like copper-binding protein
MPVIEKEKTSPPQTARRFIRPAEEVAPPPTAERAPVIMLIGGLLVAAIVLIGIVLAAGGGGTGNGGTAPAPAKPVTQAASAQPAAKAAAPVASANIAITLKEFTITPSPTVGRAGRVTFRVHNAGTMRHEFVVLRTNKPADSLLKGDEASEAGNVGEIPGLAPGATKTLRLTLKAGHYALICNMAGHYMAGQRVDFTVR